VYLNPHVDLALTDEAARAYAAADKPGRRDMANRLLAEHIEMAGVASALGAGLLTAVTGLTVWGVLLLGVAATGTGVLSRVPLAVLTLTALAAFEAVTALPAAAVQPGQARSPRAGSPPSPIRPTRSAIRTVRERCHPARSASSY
jgi:ABC-type transport system involved in cytochrome bd biosynthesis fused ATPase/permease subunit